MLSLRLALIIGLCVVTCHLHALVPGAARLPIQDVRDGTPVVEGLRLKELIPGDHRFLFRAARDRMGYPVDIPIRVIKGTDSGQVLMLLAGIYGDEAESILMVHRYLDWLTTQSVDGSVVAITGLNISGLKLASRLYPGDGSQVPPVNLDRLFPGSKDHVYPAGRMLFNFWENIVIPNVDYLVEVHGSSARMFSPYYVYADYRNRRNKDIARLLQPELIKIDKGSEGTAETAFMQSGRPALTMIMGGDMSNRTETIERVLHGLKNLSYYLELVAGHVDHSRQYRTDEVNEIATIRASEGGIIQLLVKPNAQVEQDHLVALQFDVFGDVMAKYVAPFSGTIVSVNGQSAIGPGESILRMVRKNKNSACKYGC